MANGGDSGPGSAFVRESAKWAAEYYKFFLNMVLILNSGAVIALMGMYPNLISTKGIDSAATKEIGSTLAQAGELFLYGLLAAGIVVAFTVLCQRYITDNPSATTPTFNKTVFRVGFSFGVASFALFFCGGFFILTALKQLATSAASGG